MRSRALFIVCNMTTLDQWLVNGDLASMYVKDDGYKVYSIDKITRVTTLDDLLGNEDDK